MSERTQITLVQKKIIKSLLYGLYDVMSIFLLVFILVEKIQNIGFIQGLKEPLYIVLI